MTGRAKGASANRAKRSPTRGEAGGADVFSTTTKTKNEPGDKPGVQTRRSSRGQDNARHPPRSAKPDSHTHCATQGRAEVAVARDAQGVLYIEPPIIVPTRPDPPKRTLIVCPCCYRSLIWSEFPDGSATLEPFRYDPITLAAIYRDEIEDGDGG